ncbi:S-adenosyl-L-methionine-dependent methyltransferase [Chytriomyces sp. MP71]|nr:S-adenosyl-L-methionine-dependent methyltransferase [Chytriomyces sp. MP71]
MTSTTSSLAAVDFAYWENAWQKDRTGWDLGGATPALVALLRTHTETLFPAQKGSWRVLVPGCGRGYDLAAFVAAKSGITALGVDISPTAVRELREVQKLGDDVAQVVCADFFGFEADAFDVVFDHTFLCALHPSLQPVWAAKMASLVARDGHLVCYMFPLRDPDELGPPYALSVALYDTLLSAAFEMVLVREVSQNEKPQIGYDRDHLGLQMLSVWKRR